MSAGEEGAEEVAERARPRLQRTTTMLAYRWGGRGVGGTVTWPLWCMCARP